MINKLRFVTVMGNVELDIAPDFNLEQQVTAMRAMGYVMTPQVYIPVTSILGIFTYDSSVGAPPATAPSTETRQ